MMASVCVRDIEEKTSSKILEVAEYRLAKSLPESAHNWILGSCIVEKPEEIAILECCSILQPLVTTHGL